MQAAEMGIAQSEAEASEAAMTPALVYHRLAAHKKQPGTRPGPTPKVRRPSSKRHA